MIIFCYCYGLMANTSACSTFTKAPLIHIAVLVSVILEPFWVDLLQLADIGPVVLLLTFHVSDGQAVWSAYCGSVLPVAGGRRLHGDGLPGRDRGVSARSTSRVRWVQFKLQLFGPLVFWRLLPFFLLLLVLLVRVLFIGFLIRAERRSPGKTVKSVDSLF